MVRTSSACLAIAVQACLGPPAASAGDHPDRSARGKIVIHAHFPAANDREEWGLYVVDPATDAWTRIAGTPIKNGVTALARIRVSPDATRIAYCEYRSDGRFASPDSVWLQDLRPDAGPRRISGIGGWPIWAPDGQHLLVARVVDDVPRIPARFATWKIDDDGSHAVRLPIPESDWVTDWSADGRWLAAFAPIPGREGAYTAFIMHPDGTGRRPIAGPGLGIVPRFSPDSRRIAYVAAPKDAGGSMKGQSLWVVGLDGKARRVYRETDRDRLDQAIAWSPDGKRLAVVLQTWTRIKEGGETPKNPRLALIDVEDGLLRVVAHRPATFLGSPDWR
jgi:Tol biopolymer transport system component